MLESGSKEINEKCVQSQRNGNIKLYLLHLVLVMKLLCPGTTPGNDTRLCTVLHGSYMDNLSSSRLFSAYSGHCYIYNVCPTMC